MGDSAIPKQISQLNAVGFVWEIFAAIALPTTLFALAGRWLDARWNISPWMTVLGFVLAIALSGWIVYRKAKKFAESMKSSDARLTTHDSRNV